MKKHLLSFKIFFAAIAVLVLFGFNTAVATTVTTTITGPAITTVVAGSTFTITATAATNCGFGINHVNFTGNGTNANDGSAPYSQNFVASVTPGTYAYTVTGYDNCGASNAQTINIIVIPPAPTVAVTTLPAGCGGGSTTFTAGTVNPTGGTYNWYLNSTGSAGGGIPMYSSAAKTYTVNLYSATTYYVSYTYGGLESNLTAVTANIKDYPFTTQTTAYGLSYQYPFTNNANDASDIEYL